MAEQETKIPTQKRPSIRSQLEAGAKEAEKENASRAPKKEKAPKTPGGENVRTPDRPADPSLPGDVQGRYLPCGRKALHKEHGIRGHQLPTGSGRRPERHF